MPTHPGGLKGPDSPGVVGATRLKLRRRWPLSANRQTGGEGGSETKKISMKNIGVKVLITLDIYETKPISSEDMRMLNTLMLFSVPRDIYIQLKTYVSEAIGGCFDRLQCLKFWLQSTCQFLYLGGGGGGW